MEDYRSNEMGSMPVGKLLMKTALPMMISMLVQACYNVVDSVYVSRLSQDALNAVSLAFPLQTLMIGCGVGTAVGTNALMSRYLGMKDNARANASANTGLMLSVLSSLLFVLIGLFFSRAYFKIISDNTAIVDYGTSYCMVCLCLSVGFFVQNTFERMLTATGRSTAAMIAQLAGAITNIVLDPVFIFGFPALGIPACEVLGAAIATVIGQFVGAGIAFFCAVKYVTEIRISFKGFRFDGKIIGEIYKIGLPSIVMQCVSSVMNFAMNLILISFTEAATAFFGAYYKLQSFIFMPVFGLNNGMVPIIAYNYGAKKGDRLWGTVKLSALIAVGIMSFGMLLFECIPGTLLSIFHPTEEMLSLGKAGLRIIGVHFPIAGLCIVLGSVFQAVGNPNHSLIVSIARQLAVLLPAAWILGAVFGSVTAVWFSFPLAELMSLLASLVCLRKTRKSVDAFLQGADTLQKA